MNRQSGGEVKDELTHDSSVAEQIVNALIPEDRFHFGSRFHNTGLIIGIQFEDMDFRCRGGGSNILERAGAGGRPTRCYDGVGAIFRELTHELKAETTRGSRGCLRQSSCATRIRQLCTL